MQTYICVHFIMYLWSTLLLYGNFCLSFTINKQNWENNCTMMRETWNFYRLWKIWLSFNNSCRLLLYFFLSRKKQKRRLYHKKAQSWPFKIGSLCWFVISYILKANIILINKFASYVVYCFGLHIRKPMIPLFFRLLDIKFFYS